MKYGAYLASASWKAQRKLALARAGGRCQAPRCELGYLRALSDAEVRVEEDEWLPPHAYRLEVHHLTYERLGHEHPEDLIVLCPACHAAEHGLEHHDAAFTTSMEEALTMCIIRMASAFKERS